MSITVAVPGSPSPATIETRASWLVCVTALGIAAVSFAAPAITVVGLKSIAADLGGERSVPALAYSLAWLGASVGGVAMGHAAERFGVRATVMFGSLMIGVGLVLAQSGGAVRLLIGYGVFVGLLGNGHNGHFGPAPRGEHVTETCSSEAFPQMPQLDVA